MKEKKKKKSLLRHIFDSYPEIPEAEICKAAGISKGLKHWHMTHDRILRKESLKKIHKAINPNSKTQDLRLMSVVWSWILD